MKVHATNSFQTWQPIEPLREYIAFYWSFQPSNNQVGQNVRLLPDGLPGIIFQHKAGRSVYRNDAGILPTSFLYGQATTACINYALDASQVTGVCLRPNALPRLFGTGAAAFCDALVSLPELGMYSLSDQMMHISSTKEKLTLLNRFFLSIKKWRAGNEAIVEDSLQQINLWPAGSSVERLHQQYKISERQFLRVFSRAVGVSPYRYYQTLRFQRGLKLLQEGYNETKAGLAYDLGYADQSHFIREFKAFSGLTPSQFVKTRQQALVDSRNTDISAAVPIRIVH